MSSINSISTLNLQFNAQLSSDNTRQIVQALRQGQTVNAEVLRVTPAQTALVQTQLGQFHLALPHNVQLSLGSQWTLQLGQNNQSLVLKGNGTTLEANFNTTHDGVIRQSSLNKLGQISESQLSQLAPHQLQSTHTKSTHHQLQNVLLSHRQGAAAQQNSFSGLFASLAAIVNTSTPQLQSSATAQAAFDLAKNILGLRIPADITPSNLKQAIALSGLFHEGQKSGQQSTSTFYRPASLLTDNTPKNFLDSFAHRNFKNLLFQLRSLSFHSASTVQADMLIQAQNAPPPPQSDAVLSGQKPQPAEITLDDQSQIFHKLFEQANQSLSRLKLLQIASLPQDTQEANQTEAAKLQLNLELPIALSHDQTAILALRIQRDGAEQNTETGGGQNWSIDLAFDTDETGPLDAHIHLKRGLEEGSKIRVIIWAVRKDFTDLLDSHSETLQANLADLGLVIDHIKIMNGRRPDLKSYLTAYEGHYLDQNL